MRFPPFAFLLVSLAGFAGAIRFPGSAEAQTPAAALEAGPLPADEIDTIVREVMDATQAPSASLAIARAGSVVYAKAYGHARLAPEKVPATAATRYGIGSVSKQFCAAAILLLAQDGKLRLDDPVGRYVPGLTEGDKITIRQVLSHTSGYRDYWPQDYVFAAMLKPTSADAILDGWARRPLDFEPGTDWQYSNTNYTVAGLIVERVSGHKLMEFLQERVFQPLGLTNVTECDSAPLASPDAAGYTRIGLGPVRPAPKEGPGWLFAAGGLAMSPSDLARWDLALMDGKLLSKDSFREMTTPIVPKGSSLEPYGLGVLSSKDRAGRTIVEHAGEISGSATENIFWPEQGVALAVTVNADWTEAATELVKRIRPLLLPTPGPDAVAREFFEALQTGHPDPAAMSDHLRLYYTPEALHDAATGLGLLGPVRTFGLVEQNERGGMTLRVYHAVCAHGAVEVIARVRPDGRFEQFNISLPSP